jgi:hypothetical protein
MSINRLAIGVSSPLADEQRLAMLPALRRPTRRSCDAGPAILGETDGLVGPAIQSSRHQGVVLIDLEKNIDYRYFRQVFEVVMRNPAQSGRRAPKDKKSKVPKGRTGRM